MNYENPELQHRLAAEYVLGTLQGRARARFERLLTDSESLRRKVGAWEVRLSPWVAAVPPVPVPDRVWQGVRQRLGLVGPATPDRSWRWWAFGSTAVAMVLAVLLVLRPSVPVYRDVAVLGAEKVGAVWIVRMRGDGAALALSGLARVEVPAGRDLELWAIPAGGAPQSLGVLQRTADGKAALTLDARARSRLAGAALLAISLEPAGGSPSGTPTGPVLYTGRLAS